MSPSATPGVCRSALLALTFAVCPHAFAQHSGGGGGGPRGMGQGGPGNGLGSAPGGPGLNYGPRDYGHPNGSPPPGSPDAPGGMRGSLQLGPPGRWWDDKHFAKELKLRSDQQHRMDSIFEANKPALMNRLFTVQQEELRMEALTRARTPDEGTLSAQIDRVWQARAELEKAKTHYLLQIRQEMDADQIAKLEEHR